MDRRTSGSFLRGALSAILCVGLATQSSIAYASFQDEALPAPDSLSDEEKLELAKKLYLEAKGFHPTGVLPLLLDADRLRTIDTVLIQFHEWLPRAYWRRWRIRRREKCRTLRIQYH